MKISIGGFDVKISDWSRRLEIAYLVSCLLVILSLSLTLFAKITVPGMTQIVMSVFMLLMGVRMYDHYYNQKLGKIHLIIGMLCTLMFVLNLCLGIKLALDGIFVLL